MCLGFLRLKSHSLVLASCTLACCTAAQAVPNLSVGSTTAWPGKYELVPVTLVTDQGVSGMQFDIVFDPTQLVLDPAFVIGGALGSHAMAMKNESATGRVKFVVTPPGDGNGVLAQGTLVQLPFTLKQGATASAKVLALQNVVFGNPAADGITGSVTNGAVTWSADFDNDGIPDELDPDDDNDGMPDWYEIQHGLNPYYAGDAGLDLDGDGLTNLQESAYGTNPRLADSDGDGINDKDEIALGRNPNIDDKLIPVIITIINSILLE